jgi:biopolymer transport protein ExbD
MPKRTNISSILIIGALLVSGCTAHPSADQTKLDEMASACNLPKGSAIHQPDDRVELKIPRDAKFDDVACLLEKLKSAGVKNLGFVGNEQQGIREQK